MRPKSSRVGRSLAVRIAFTPLIFFAAAVSMPAIRAYGCGLRSVALEGRVGRDDEARRAEPALHRASVDERALDRMQPVAIRERLDGLHCASRGCGAEHETRADELAVHQDRAGSALALLAGILASCEAEALAQDGKQALMVRRFGLPFVTVKGALDRHMMTALSARASAPN